MRPLHAGIGVEAAVYGRNCARNIARGVRGIPDTGPHKVLRSSHAAHGGMRNDFLTPLRVASIRITQGSQSTGIGNESGSDGVDADERIAFLGDVRGQPLGKVGYGRLGCGVAWTSFKRPEGIHGRDVDDGTSIRIFCHLFSVIHARVEAAAEKVQMDDLMEGVKLQIKEGFSLARDCGGDIASPHS